MTIKPFIKGMILFIPLLLLSCNEEQTITESKCKIICSVDEFESTDLSRTTTDPNNNFLITWASGDIIGIFPREGYQEPFEIPTNQIGNTSASFEGGYWDVKDGLQYNAYYPFDKKNFDSADMKTKIPISYIGQKQNGTSCNIGAFDYTYSDWKTASGGIVSFDFHHIGAIAVFSLKYPATTTYTKLTLSADDAVIPLEGTYDLTAEDVSFIADENSYSNSISLELNNCSGVAGETGVFYMMLPPMDLTNNEVTFTLTTSAGTACTYSIEKALNVKKGKLYKRTGIPTESNVEGTIDGWIEESIPYVTFTADATQTLTMSKAVETLEYSVNGGEWKELGTNTVTFGGENGTLRLRGQSSIGTATSISDYSNISFGNSIPVACSGDIRTLVDYNKYTTVDTSNAKFCYLFKQCVSLTSSPKLPAMSLSESCYSWMFYGCYSLTSAPELPATIMTESCYYGMFEQCYLLSSAPKLPATILAKTCYIRMFNSCQKLKSAPELPATTLAESCYNSMFSGCTSLESAPKLPATTLEAYCYSAMFSGCKSLVSAPELPATTLVYFCYSDMFKGCTKLENITMLATKNLLNVYMENWVSGVASTGTFIKAKGATTITTGASGIPKDWNVINYEDL